MRSFALQIATGLRAQGHHVREITAPLLLGRLARRQRFSQMAWLRRSYVLFRLQLGGSLAVCSLARCVFSAIRPCAPGFPP